MWNPTASKNFQLLDALTLVATLGVLAFLVAPQLLAQPPAAGRQMLQTQSSPGVEAEAAKVFDDAATYVPPDKLPIVDVFVGNLLAREELNLNAAQKDIASELRTVYVTREGEVSTGEAPSADEVQTFTEMLRVLNAAEVESPLGEIEPQAPARPESLIGEDTRVRVTNTTAFPFRAAGRIDIGCTGTLVGPRHVLTAGHCVYNINNDQWYSQLDFTPGQNGSTKPYGTISWRRALAVTGWTQSHDRNYDYAMIILDQPIGNQVGTMGYAHDPALPMHNVNINGYPADKPLGTMWHSFGAIRLIQPFRLYHDCDTFGGNSGSAVYAYFSTTGQRKISGIHAYGVDSTGYNGATRINKNVYDKITEWISSN